MVLPTSSTANTECTCRHSLDCNCECHGRHCDPTEHVCSIEFLPDEGGLTPWGCPVCTPGSGLPHAASCPAAALAPASVPEILLVGDAGRADVALSDSGGGNAPSTR